MIAGAAELDTALSNILKADMAFVIPLSDSASPNAHDNGVVQDVTERFGVVVALATDSSDKDKTGITAYDLVHDVRNELFKALVGWLPDGQQEVVTYRGGRTLGVNRAYLWYQFEFETAFDLLSYYSENGDINGVEIDRSALADFDTIYANIIKAPDARLPYTGDLPLDDGYPDVTLPTDMATWVDLTDDPRRGAFWMGFGSGFDTYDKDRR